MVGYVASTKTFLRSVDKYGVDSLTNVYVDVGTHHKRDFGHPIQNLESDRAKLCMLLGAAAMELQSPLQVVHLTTALQYSIVDGVLTKATRVDGLLERVSRRDTVQFAP